MTHWQGNDVLYIGDHIYGDLAVSQLACYDCEQWNIQDLFLKYGWRTGAILEEVEDEIGILNSDAFQKTIHWVLNEYILESDDDLYVFLGFF